MATRLTPAKRKAEALSLLDSPKLSAVFERVRLTVDPPPEPVPPNKKSSLPAAIGIGVLCTVAWWCFTGPRAGAIRATLPGGSHAEFPAVGETCLYRGDFSTQSGIQTLRQLEVIKSGATSSAGPGLAARGIGFTVLANWFTAAFDSYYAPIALNLVLCWLCAWLVARTTTVLFHDRAKSIFAAVCFSLSIVATSLVGEVGPGLMAVCFCYLWTLLLVAKDENDAPLGVRGSPGMAVLLGLWSLVSINSLAGLVVYAVLGVKRRRLEPIMLAAICWGLFPFAQDIISQRLGLAVERTAGLAVIGTAVKQHGSHLMADPLGYAGFLAVETANLAFDENPLGVMICLAGIGLVPHKSRWLLRACYLVPIFVQLILLPTTQLRGAAIAGNTIVVFVLASHYCVEFSRRLQARFGADAFVVPLVLLAVFQAIWGYSGLAGWNFPVAALETGALREVGTALPTQFARLSGSPHEVPTVLGGPVRGPRFSGLVKDQSRPPIFATGRVAPYRDNWSGLPSLQRWLTAQAMVLASLLIATLCLMRIWRGLATVLLFAACSAGALLCGSTTGFVPQSFVPLDGRIAIKGDDKLVGTVQLSPEFVSQLQDSASSSEQIEFFVRLEAVNAAAEHPAEFQVAEWSAAESRFAVPAQAFLDAVRARNGRVEFSITAATVSRGLRMHSWQATRASGERTAEIVHADGSHEALECFPSFEIRVLRPRTDFAFQNLIDRVEPAHSASYALIGF
jgi:hypothetical protein